MGIQDLFRRPKMPRVPLHCLRRVKELGVVESKRGAIRKGLVQELLYAQDTVLCSYFAQREGATNGDKGRWSKAAEVFQGLDRFG